MSHRGTHFKGIIEETTERLKTLLGLSDQYAVLYATGGATNQFSMVPMNLLREDETANYILSGPWSEKALAEAEKFGQTHIAASSKEASYKSIPAEISPSPNPAYLHFTSNNTIVGTQFSAEPDAGDAPLVCDASSDFLHKKIDVTRYGLIYAGAQKNLGPAGVTVIIARKDLLERSSDTLPVLMNYQTYAKTDSLYNTPPTFPIYVVREVLRWIEAQGGLEAMETRNKEKASLLYQRIDSSDFYRGHAEARSRSLMNVTFRLHSEDLEQKFIAQAEAAGLLGLKGHRSVGGLRASIYNAFPVEGVKKLVQFMDEFESLNGE